MKEGATKRGFIRVVIVLLIAVTAIYIFKSGYKIGHWLQELVQK